MKKITKKPAFTVDITKCETINDVIVKIIEAKLDAEVHVSKAEIMKLAATYVKEEVKMLYMHWILLLMMSNVAAFNYCDEPKTEDEPKTKKPNIFKRILNWFKK